jgi:uncharacterized membrane protein
MIAQGLGAAGRIREVIEISALAIEMLAVAVILVAIVHGTARYLTHRNRIRPGEAYSSYRVQLGKALLIGLELLVAADIVRTVVLNPTLSSVAVLGFLVLIRTFLSWSLVVEIEGRWPWKSAEAHSNPVPGEESS